MSRNAIIAIIVIIIIVVGGYFAFAHKASAPSTSPAAAATPVLDASSTAATGVTHIVTYTDAGFSPKDLTIGIGDTVQYVNNSSHGMWVASDAHPTHTDYDGTSLSQHCTAGADTNGGFDECEAIDPGNSYSFTFPKAGSFMWHNHVQPNDMGTVVVQ